MTRLLVITALAACGASAPSPGAPADRPHDFDFHVGTWTTKISRLTAPLSGSSEWVEYEGTTVVHPIWGGRANLVELVADGPAGHLELLSLRLFDPNTGQWSLHVASARGGGISPPVVGAFVDGRGEFLGTETIEGREIRIRFVINDITATSARFEQAFSADGGATWEVNWRATDTRVSSTTPG
jgi:hypothetical protein